MPDLNRYRIDDGAHWPRFTIDEDASAAAGIARYRAACSCGRLPETPPGDHDQAVTAHLAHAMTKIGPTRGPAWLPLGVRIALLLVGMFLLWGGWYAGGQYVVHDFALTGGASVGVIGGCHVTGLLSAFALMVGVRHYIAPTVA